MTMVVGLTSLIRALMALREWSTPMKIMLTLGKTMQNKWPIRQILKQAKPQMQPRHPKVIVRRIAK